MTYLPSTDSTDLATRADFQELKERIGSVESKLTERVDSVEANLIARIDALGTRIDRIVFALVAALAVIVARSFF